MWRFEGTRGRFRSWDSLEVIIRLTSEIKSPWLPLAHFHVQIGVLLPLLCWLPQLPQFGSMCCCRHCLLLPWLPLLPCFVQDHTSFLSVSLLFNTPIWSGLYSAVIVVSAIAAGSLSCHVQINVLLLSLPAAGSRSTREGTASLGVIPCSARWRKFTFRDLCVAVVTASPVACFVAVMA